MKPKTKEFNLFEDEDIFEEDIYNWEGRDHMVDDDMLSSEEAGFMQGYEEAG